MLRPLYITTRVSKSTHSLPSYLGWCKGRTVQIHNSNVSPRHYERLAHHQSQSSRSACDNTYPILKREARERALEVETTPTLDRLLTRQVGFLGILDPDSIIGSGVLALVLEGTRFTGGGIVGVVLGIILLLKARLGGSEGGSESWCCAVEGRRTGGGGGGS